MARKICFQLLIFSLLVKTAAFAAETIAVTYEELPRLLDARSPRIEASRARKEAVSLRTGYLTRAFFPTLSLHAEHESFKVGKDARKAQPAYGAEINMNVFNSGRDSLESKRRNLTASKGGFEHQRITSEELQKVRSLYWQIIFSQEKIQLIEETIKINQQNLSSADRRVRSGVATESDRVEFEMKAVDLRRDSAESQLKLRAERSELAVLLNISENSDMELPAKLTHEHDFEALLQYSEKDHEYLYKENELQAEGHELAAINAKRIWLPRLDAYAAYNQFNEREKEFTDVADRTESVVGVRLTMNLADGWEGRYESSSFLKEAYALKKVSEVQRLETIVHLKNELAELRFLHGQVHDAEENITRAEKYYKLTQSEYVRGVKNSPDVLGASEKIYEMKYKKIEIIKNFQIVKSHVLSKIGK